MNSLILALAAMPSQGTATAPTAARWQLERGENTCSIILHGGSSAKDISLAVRHTPGQTEVFVHLINTSWSHSPVANPTHLTLSLEPGGTVGETMSSYSRNNFELPQPSVNFYVAAPAFLAELSTANALVVSDKGRPFARFELPVADKAVAALRSCEAARLKQWKIDPAFLFSLRSTPVPEKSIASYVSDSDFPTGAVPSEFAGQTVVKVLVDIRGKGRDCTVLETSGSGMLDSFTCRILEKQVRFRPAVGADGNVVAAPYVVRMWWFGSNPPELPLRRGRAAVDMVQTSEID
jgi:hypothetical protein